MTPETQRRIKRASVAATTALYGIPQLTDYFDDSVDPRTRAQASSPDVEEQRTNDGVRRTFDAAARFDQAGTSREATPGLLMA